MKTSTEGGKEVADNTDVITSDAEEPKSTSMRTRSRALNRSGVTHDQDSSVLPGLATKAGDGPALRTRRHQPPAVTGGNSADRPQRRHSVRKAVLEKKPKPTLNIKHTLFLEPTLVRQARKKREKERKRSKRALQQRHEDEGHDHSDVEHSDTSDASVPSSSGRHGSRKRPHVTGLMEHTEKKIPVHQTSLSVARVNKAPKRKMSAMAPDLRPSVATFYESEGDVRSTPETARNLARLADMFRRKKKKPKRRKHRTHNAEESTEEHHPVDSAMEEDQSVSGASSVSAASSVSEGEDCAESEVKASATVSTTQKRRPDVSLVTPPRDSDEVKSQDDSDDDEVIVVGHRPAPLPAERRPTPTTNFDIVRSVPPAGVLQYPLDSRRSLSAANLQSLATSTSGNCHLSIAELTPWHNQTIETAAGSERAVSTLMKRRHHVLDYLMAANSFPSIFAGLAAIHDLFNQEDYVPAIARVLLDSHAVGTLLLTSLLKNHLMKPPRLGGLGCSEFEAGLLAKRILDKITPVLVGDMVILPEQLLPTLSLPEVLQIAPMLRTISLEVRREFFSLSDRLIAMGSESSTPLAVPTVRTVARHGLGANRGYQISRPDGMGA